MAELGHFALILALFLTAYALFADSLGCRLSNYPENSPRPPLQTSQNSFIKSARNAAFASWLCLSCSLIALTVLLLRCDFSVSYVSRYTSTNLPLIYRISALWAGAQGSLLLWLWLQASFANLAFGRPTARGCLLRPSFRIFTNLVCIFFLIILILDKSPFASSPLAPAQGAGMNPLLQHPAMVLHPPALFIGYAALIIPFAWSMANLGKTHPNLFKPALNEVRKWTLFAWLSLTIGIVLGAWWAYEELGWGGYWNWDPVENSSLMPWLAATALLHSFRTYKPGTSIAKWLTFLSLLTYSLCIFGTFLTRYGLLTSVHAFTEPGLGILFLVLLAAIWITAGILTLKYSSPNRAKHPATKAKSVFILNNWLMLVLALVIFIGTMFPFFTSIFSSQVISLKSEYFTKITAPPALLVLLLLAVCPSLWRYGFSKNYRTITALVAAIAAVTLWAATGSPALSVFLLSGFAILNIAADFAGLFARTSNARNISSSRKPLRWYAARIAHLGVVFIFIGIAGSGKYTAEKQKALEPGQSITIGKYRLKYQNLRADHKPNFTAVIADVTLYHAQNKNETGKTPLAELAPAQAYYYSSNKKTSEVDIKRSLKADIYVALTALDRKTGLINILVMIKPLVNWIWIGSALLILGAFLALLPASRTKKSQMI